MKRPSFYLILVILVGAAVLWLERPRDRAGEFESLDLAAVHRIKIARFVEGVELNKDDENWVATSFITPMAEKIQAQHAEVAPAVQNLPADPAKVANAIQTLKLLEIRGLASHDAEKNPQFEVNDIGTHVEVFDASGRILADLYIGKLAPDMVSTYVRRQGSQNVQLARGFVGGQFPAGITAWKAPDAKPADVAATDTANTKK